MLISKIAPNCYRDCIFLLGVANQLGDLDPVDEAVLQVSGEANKSTLILQTALCFPQKLQLKPCAAPTSATLSVWSLQSPCTCYIKSSPGMIFLSEPR